MQKAILTNMVINSTITFFPDKNNPTYCIFVLSSAKPQRNGLWFQAECRASNRLCEEVIRLKLHQKSFVDVIGTIVMYEKKEVDGSTRNVTAFEISDITISETLPMQEKGEDHTKNETKKETPEDKRNSYINKLLTDPFKRGGKK